MLMKGKKGIILGVANQRSIAWGIAQSLFEQGAEIAFTYIDDRNKQVLEKLLSSIGKEAPLYLCNVLEDETISNSFGQLGKDFGEIDFVIHSLAFANKDELDGEFIETSAEGYKLACEVSAYSLVPIAREARKILNKEAGSIVALTYLGSEKIVTNYNVMGVAKAALESTVRYLANDLGPEGIRVNAISAGPVNTLAARGISNFTNFLKIHRQIAPLRSNTTIKQVGDTATFLCSDMGSGITAEVIYVDGGFRHIGVGPVNSYKLDSNS